MGDQEIPQPHAASAPRYCPCGTRLSVSNPGSRCALCERKNRDRRNQPPILDRKIWDGDHLSVALATQNMGALFRAYRSDPCHRAQFGPQGITQAQLAAWLGITQTQVSRIECGTSSTDHLNTLTRWAQTLHIPHDKLWFRIPHKDDEQSSPAPQKLVIQHTQDGSATTEAEKLNVTAGINGRIVAIRAMLSSFQIADRKIGGGLLYGTIVQYIKSEVAPSLLDLPCDCSSSEMFSAAASVTEVAGWMAHDSGNDDKAHGHFSQAYHLAIAANNPVLSANVCASLSHLAIQRDQADDALRISTTGLPWAAQGEGTAQLIGRLHAMRARALAKQGDERGCRLELDAAREAIGNHENSISAEWIAGFDEASLAGEAALSLYSIGALAEAESEGRKVIELRRCGDRARSLAFGQLTLANVLLSSGVIEEAAAVGSEICPVVASLNSTRVHSGLSELGKKLSANRTIPKVADFLDNLLTLTGKTTPVNQMRWPL